MRTDGRAGGGRQEARGRQGGGARMGCVYLGPPRWEDLAARMLKLATWVEQRDSEQGVSDRTTRLAGRRHMQQ